MPDLPDGGNVPLLDSQPAIIVDGVFGMAGKLCAATRMFSTLR